MRLVQETQLRISASGHYWISQVQLQTELETETIHPASHLFFFFFKYGHLLSDIQGNVCI